MAPIFENWHDSGGCFWGGGGVVTGSVRDTTENLEHWAINGWNMSYYYSGKIEKILEKKWLEI